VSRGAKAVRGLAKGATLSAEDRAFLDFIARLAVEMALNEANAVPGDATCVGEQAGRKSKGDGHT
jgi:hypothetical protein